MVPKVKKIFVVAVLVSLIIVGIVAFQWTIVDLITPFLYAPLVILLGMLFLGTAIASLTVLFQFKKYGLASLAPLAVNIMTLFILFLVPFTDIWLQANFFCYRSAREKVVQQVMDGLLQSNVAHNPALISLGNNYSLVSKGGNEIVVEDHGGGKYIFFYTFRGVLDNYSGFLYLPAGGKPQLFMDLIDVPSSQIIPWDGNWYYVSHR